MWGGFGGCRYWRLVVVIGVHVILNCLTDVIVEVFAKTVVVGITPVIIVPALTLRRVKVVILTIQTFGSRAIKVEPPDAREDLLVENCAIGAQKGPSTSGKALMPNLAPSLHVRVHTV